MKLYKNKEYKTPDKNRTLIIRATPQDSIEGVEPPKGKKPKKENFYIVELRDYEEIAGGRSYKTEMFVMDQNEIRKYLNCESRLIIV